MDLGCSRKFEVGDFIADRWETALCEECDEETPAPLLGIWATGVVNETTLEKKPGLKCGDNLREENDCP